MERSLALPGGSREVLRLAWPLVLSSLSWTVMTFVDRIFLMWWSTQATAAAYPASLLWWTMLCLPLGICGYVSTFVAQYYGMDAPRRAGPAVWQGLWTGLLLAPVTLITSAIIPTLVSAAGHPAEVQQQEVLYYQILVLAGPAMLFSTALSAFFSATKRTHVVMFVDMASTLINVVLDYLWIFGVMGFPAGGITGAGWATVTASWLRTVAYFALFLRAREHLRYGTREWYLEIPLIRRLWYYGVPSGLQIFLEIVGFTVFVLLLGTLGTEEMAASNLALNVSSFAFMPVFGFGQTASILVGYYLGRSDWQSAARATRTAAAFGISYMVCISALYVIVPDIFLFGYFLFHAEEGTRIYSIARILLRYIAAYNVFDAMNIIFSYAVKGAGDTYFVFYVSIVMAVLLAATTWLAVHRWQASIYDCWLVMTLWTCLLGLLYLGRYLSGAWKSMRVTELQADQKTLGVEL